MACRDGENFCIIPLPSQNSFTQKFYFKRLIYGYCLLEMDEPSRGRGI